MNKNFITSHKSVPNPSRFRRQNGRSPRLAGPAGLSLLFALIACSLLFPPASAVAGRLMRQVWPHAAAGKSAPETGRSTPAVMKRSSAAPRSAKSKAAKNPILGTANLSFARQGHAAARLSDGKVLIIGGQGSDGPVKEAEIFNPVARSFTIAANSNVPRTEHTVTWVNDEQILVAGGRNHGAVLKSTEIYDYNANNFTNGPQLSRSRSGHTATVLVNGKILIAGGDEAGTAELYDPTTRRFTLLASRLSVARSFHTAGRLKNGKVLIVGGQAATGEALNSGEIFDPVTSTFSPARNQMQGSRVRPMINVLPDGKAQIIGGDSDSTMEVFNAGGEYFTAYAHLANRPDEAARLLGTPGRAAVIHRKSGKKNGKSAQYRPSESSNSTERAAVIDWKDLKKNGGPVAVSTAASAKSLAVAPAQDPQSDPLLDRDNSTTTDLGDSTLVTGGVNSDGAPLNTAVIFADSPATVTTDKSDYPPGETVTITGSGWQSGETVRLTLHRDSGAEDTVLTAIADAAGNITNAEYVCQHTDANVSFILTAEGLSSGFIAQTTFTDGPKVGMVTVGAQSPSSVTAGNNATYTVTVNRGNSNAAFTANLTVITSLPSGAAASPASVSFGSNDNSKTTTLTISTSPSTPAGQTSFTVRAQTSAQDYADGNGTLNVACTSPSIGIPPASQTRTVGESVTFNVTASGSAPLSYQWRKNGINITGATGNSYTIASVVAANAGNYDVVVANACGSATSTPAAVLSVSKVTPTITWNNPVDITYGTALGAAQLSATANVPGAFVYTPAAGTVLNFGPGQTLSVNFTPTDTANYNTAGKSVTINVLKKTATPTVTVNNKIYDGTAAATIAARSLSGVVGSDDVSLAGGAATFSDKQVGAGKPVTVTGLSLTGAGMGNYQLSSTTAATTADITPKALTVTAAADNKVYDGTAAATVTLSDNRVSGDVFTVSYTSASFADQNAGNGKIVTVSGIAISGADADNYTFNTTATTTAEITPRPITVTADAKTKVYGDADPALTYQTTSGSLVAGDSFSGALTRAAGENVGTYAIQQGTLALNGNYTLTYAGANLAITPRQITVTASPQTKVFGSADPALTYQITSGSLVGSDSFAGVLARTAGENVGAYAILQGTLASNGNYHLTYLGASLTITPAPAVYAVSVTPGTQQYSDKVTLAAALSPAAVGGQPPATSVTFSIGSQNIGPFALSNIGGVLKASTEIQLSLAPGTYPVTVAFGGLNANFSVTGTGATLTITAEDAAATYTGALFASTSSATSGAATVTLSATIKDISAVMGDPAYDSNAGDIRNAKVTFINRDNNTVIKADLPVGLVSAGDTTVGTVTYNWSTDIGPDDSRQYTIGIIVTDYYTRNNSIDNAIVTVSRPLGTNFITGGGYLTLTASSGLMAGDAGTKNNFGFNVKYNKSGSNLQGNINTIVRRKEADGVLHVYQIKGNAMTSLSTTVGAAVFNGKASIQDITNPFAPIAIEGNATLQVTITDKGEPGSADASGLTVWNKAGGLWFSSNWNGTKTVEQLIGGGNLVVR